jgi:hypothetical protein
MSKITTGVKSYSNSIETSVRKKMLEHFKECPIPEDQILSNMGLFINSKDLSRILFMDYLYRISKDTQGVILDLGTRWGQNAAIFSACRGLYEPFNRHRKIIAFDTFSGFPSVEKDDGDSDLMETENYEKYLNKTLELQEQDNPLSHIKKFEVVKGDACESLEQYLKDNPHTIVSLAYFDFDIYKPTKICLNLIKNRIVKGSVIAFDELNDVDSPGETLAVMETLGLKNIRLKRFPYTSRVSYFIVE